MCLLLLVWVAAKVLLLPAAVLSLVGLLVITGGWTKRSVLFVFVSCACHSFR
jgi:hypothetical protein